MDATVQYPIIQCDFDTKKQYNRVRALLFLFPIAGFALVFAHPLLFVVPIVFLMLIRKPLLRWAFPNKHVGNLNFTDDGFYLETSKEVIQFSAITDIKLEPVIASGQMALPLYMPSIPAEAYEISLRLADGGTRTFVAGSAPIDGDGNRYNWLVIKLLENVDLAGIRGSKVANYYIQCGC